MFYTAIDIDFLFYSFKSYNVLSLSNIGTLFHEAAQRQPRGNLQEMLSQTAILAL